jgi:hypothetical protein
MNRQITMFEPVVLPADVVYTPRLISQRIIQFLQPKGFCLDPCKGDGAFYDYLPSAKDYCEIKEGLDFLNYKTNVDWIIGNPPYSIFKDFLEKSFEIANNVSFLVPTNKIFQRQIIMDMINKYGGIKSVIVFGSGQLIDFPFGFSVGNFHFEKEYAGETRMILGMKQVLQMPSKAA